MLQWTRSAVDRSRQGFYSQVWMFVKAAIYQRQNWTCANPTAICHGTTSNTRCNLKCVCAWNLQVKGSVNLIYKKTYFSLALAMQRFLFYVQNIPKQWRLMYFFLFVLLKATKKITVFYFTGLNVLSSTFFWKELCKLVVNEWILVHMSCSSRPLPINMSWSRNIWHSWHLLPLQVRMTLAIFLSLKFWGRLACSFGGLSLGTLTGGDDTTNAPSSCH